MMNVTFPDKIAEKIQAKCQEVGMTRSELVREAMRLAYGISEEDTETRKEEYKIYLTKDNYDYLFRCCFPTGNKNNGGYAENIEEFVNKRFIPDTQVISNALLVAMAGSNLAHIYTNNEWRYYHNSI